MSEIILLLKQMRLDLSMFRYLYWKTRQKYEVRKEYWVLSWVYDTFIGSWKNCKYNQNINDSIKHGDV